VRVAELVRTYSGGEGILKRASLFVIVNVIVMENIAVDAILPLCRKRVEPRFQRLYGFGLYP